MMTGDIFFVYGALSISILMTFSKAHITFNTIHIPAWIIPFTLSCVLAIGFSIIEWLTLPIIGFYFLCAYFAVNTKTRIIKLITLFILIGTSLALAIHAVPGFNNPVLFDNLFLGQHSKAPFSLHANFDKAIVGLGLIGFLLGSHNRPKYQKTYIWPLILASCILINCLGYFLGLRIDFKVNETILVFYWVNLLFTCVAEEAFFRLLIQESIAKLFDRYRWGSWATVIITTGLFLSAHIAGIQQIEQGIMILIAGLAYAIFYEKTKSLLVAVATHFGVNAIHITFLSYPLVF